jgi:hypothetical protein
MQLAILICLIVICLVLTAIAVCLGLCVMALEAVVAFLSTLTGRKTDVVRMPWEGDESTLNVVKPRGEFPDQM